MTEFKKLTNLTSCYELENFKPITINTKMLDNLGIDYPVPEDVGSALEEASEWYRSLFENRVLNPATSYNLVLTDPEKELEIHNYTGICPTNVLEVSPAEGSCSVGCQYCLVTDGKHLKKTDVFSNYHEKLASSLQRNRHRNIFYYFSPKTEAFSEPLLYSGVAHKIMKCFIDHFELYPDSCIRIFIATKAGLKHLEFKHEGTSLIELISRIASKVQVNGSIGIMPSYIRNILEPNAAGIDDRLAALKKLRSLGVESESVLCQPLFLPYLDKDSVTLFIKKLAAAGIKNIKPEFFTADIRNIVLVSQYINHFDPGKLGEFLYPYLMEGNLNHIKQRSRLAPDRKTCVAKLRMIEEIASENGISISICNWVKRELGSVDKWVNQIDGSSSAKGYRCLGYQTALFRQ